MHIHIFPTSYLNISLVCYVFRVEEREHFDSSSRQKREERRQTSERGMLCETKQMLRGLDKILLNIHKAKDVDEDAQKGQEGDQADVRQSILQVRRK